MNETVSQVEYPFRRVLVTGGGGYIGSHICLALLRAQIDVVVLDNFCNSSPKALDRVQRIAGRSLLKYKADICDPSAVSKCFKRYKPDAVIHLAGLKAVSESRSVPLDYYRTNVEGTRNLLCNMSRYDCLTLVFSSSATVYGQSSNLPYHETHSVTPLTPYGRTKLISEHMIRDWSNSVSGSGVSILRYFNPVGADASGEIGEDPRGVPSNLLPYIAQVAVGRQPFLNVFGSDYATRDGTAERDYIHVSDLADIHIKALEFSKYNHAVEVFNAGTGQGFTVVEMLRAYERVNNCLIPHVFKGRRCGDVARSIAAVDKAKALLSWSASLTIEDMCRSVDVWQKNNPQGYVD